MMTEEELLLVDTQTSLSSLDENCCNKQTYRATTFINYTYYENLKQSFDSISRNVEKNRFLKVNILSKDHRI